MPSTNFFHHTGKNVTEASSNYPPIWVNFWQDLGSALVAAEPKCDSLKSETKVIWPPWDPLDNKRKHLDRLKDFTEEKERAMFLSHYTFRRSARRLAPDLPFNKGTTGVVTTGDARLMPVLLVSLRMLRKTGCTLPVEVFIDDWTVYQHDVCDVLLPSLNARCIVVSNIYNTAKDVKKAERFLFKPLAILYSSFQNVLFLDSDSFPLYDPSILFLNPPYTTHGLVVWPDWPGLGISEHFYHVADLPEEPPSNRFSTESGQILINKQVHRESLLMMLFYNYYGPDHFHVLTSQLCAGAGDKDTYVPAAMAVGLPWYQVRTRPAVMGRWQGGKKKTGFPGCGFAQADPMLDWDYMVPMPSHLQPEQDWKYMEFEHADRPAEQAQKALKPENYEHLFDPPRMPRPFFFHQTWKKLNPHKILKDIRKNIQEEDGMPHRMWGNKTLLISMLGFDAEKRLWDVLEVEGCRANKTSKTCRDIKKHISGLFDPSNRDERPDGWDSSDEDEDEDD